MGKSWRGIFSAFLVPSSINLNISSVALMAALPIPSHPSIFHLHIQISRWTPPGGGQGQCAQFFIRAHFCKNTDEIRAIFCQKYGRKLQHHSTSSWRGSGISSLKGRSKWTTGKSRIHCSEQIRLPELLWDLIQAFAISLQAPLVHISLASVS